MEEIIFKTTVQTGNTVNDINKINASLKETDKASDKVGTDISKRFEELNKRVASGTLTMRESAKAVKEYQTIALQAGRDSPIGQQAIQQAAQLHDTLADLRNEITRASHDGANMQAALQLGSTVTAGYGALQGAMALVGGSSEELQKTFVKLQAVQSILAGIEAVRANLEKESFLMQKAKVVQTKAMIVWEKAYAVAVGTTTGAMKALRLAMLALPIVAIIAGIVALISAISSLVAESEIAEEANENLTKSYERQSGALDRISKQRMRDIENQIKLRKSQNASEEELHKLELGRLYEIENQRRANMKLEDATIKARREAYNRALVEGNHDLARSIKAEIKQHKDKFNELDDLNKQYQVDKEVLENEFKKKQQEKEASERKTANDNAKKRREDEKKRLEEKAKLEAEYQRLLQDFSLAILEETGYKQLEILRVQQEREKEELIKKYGERSELVKSLELKQAKELQDLEKQLNDENTERLNEQTIKEREAIARDRRARLEGELIGITEDFYAKQELEKELALLEMEEALLQEELTAGEKFKIKQEYNEKINTINKESADYEIELAKKVAEEKELMEQQIRDSATNLADAYFTTRLMFAKKGSKEEEKIARQQFAVNKAMQLSMATIDGFKAITSTLAQSPVAIGPLPNPAGIASLAFATTTTLASISKILATKFEGGSQSVSAPTPPTISPVNAPQNPINTFGGNSSTLTDNQQQNVQVVVVDSDITAQQSNTARVKSLSTIM
jgi:hypothetical protein